MKLLIFGIDGLDLRFLETWSQPRLKEWRKKARWGTMWSAEKRTGPSWTSIMTGWSCGHHGITNLFGINVSPNPNGKEPPFGFVPSKSFPERPADYLFDETIAAGLKTGVINFPGIPFIRPLECRPDRGFLIGGWPFHPKAWPESVNLNQAEYFTGEADAALRSPEILALKPKGSNVGWEVHAWKFENWLKWIEKQEAYKLDVASSLARQYGGLEVLMFCTQIWDRGCHMLSSKMQGSGLGAGDPRIVGEMAPVLDRIFGSWIDRFNPEMIAICSDHGFDGGAHSYWGIWGISGPNVIPGRHGTIDQTDFTPTILGRLGIEVGFGRSKRRDGFDALKNGRVYSEKERLSLEDFTEAEDEQVRNALAALGYLG